MYMHNARDDLFQAPDTREMKHGVFAAFQPLLHRTWHESSPPGPGVLHRRHVSLRHVQSPSRAGGKHHSQLLPPAPFVHQRLVHAALARIHVDPPPRRRQPGFDPDVVGAVHRQTHAETGGARAEGKGVGPLPTPAPPGLQQLCGRVETREARHRGAARTRVALYLLRAVLELLRRGGQKTRGVCGRGALGTGHCVYL